MRDAFNRTIDYLRIAVTDRCNLRCQYCMPSEGVTLFPRQEMLHYGEIATIVEDVMLPLGIDKIRLTGGEPLVRKDLIRLVERLGKLSLRDLAMTTNAILLADAAKPLKAAGLRRINISLDTLDPVRYATITRGGDLNQALAGIKAAIAVGFSPVKINAVITHETAQDLKGFLALIKDHPVHLRFIEMMPLGDRQFNQDYLSAEALFEHFKPLALEEMKVAGNGPAQSYRIPGYQGTIGMITPMSHRFCSSCNRLRLTADGKLKPCLMHGLELDLKTPFREGASPDVLQALVCETLARKPEHQDFSEQPRRMAQIGG
jgi:cyclic pyranopterin phosphate synthase